MKIEKNYLVLVLILSSIMLHSCSDILNEELVSDIGPSYYNSVEGVNSGINAAYRPLRSYYGSEWGTNLTEFGTDVITNAGEGSYHYMNQYTGQLNSEADPFWNLWSNFYQGINTCNTVIQSMQNIDLSEEEKNAKIAEVRFLRAHYYFQLVRFFGPVTLTLEPAEGVETEAERSPENEVYVTIVNDLEFAIANLPETQNEFGRPTLSAAKHMLSLVLLTRGYKEFAEADDYSRAANLAIDVIENSPHRLLDGVMDVFDPDNEENDAIIWSVQWSQDVLLNGGGANGNYAYYRPWYEIYSDGLVRSVEEGYGRPFVRLSPTPWALENFRPLDIDSRFNTEFQVVWEYNNPSGLPEGAAVGDTALWVTDQNLGQSDVDEIKERLPGIILFSWNLNDMNESWYRAINMWPSLNKWNDWGDLPTLSALRSSRDFIVYRLTHTYFNAAEALMMDGQTEEAVKYINIIRRRAAYPGMEDQMEITASELDMDFYLDERARELYGEHTRWLVLKRTGKLLERVRAHNPEAAPLIDEHHLLRPIPAEQITRTTNEYSQNPGY